MGGKNCFLKKVKSPLDEEGEGGRGRLVETALAEVEVGGAHTADGAQKCEQPCAAGSGGEVEERRVAACEEGCFERVAGKRTAPPRF